MNPGLASALTHALFHFLWQGAAVALVLAAVLYGARPRSANVRYGFACVAMLAMLAAFGATAAHFWPRSHPLVIREVPVPPAVAPVAAGGVDTPSAGFPRQNWIVPSWLVGVLLFSLRSFGAWFAAARLKRTAIGAGATWQDRLGKLAERVRVSRPVRLLESCAVEIPVVIGFLKPAILVPASLLTGFPPEHLEVILLHELAHIRRQDYLVNLLQSIVEDILFYHPAVWWVSSVIRAEREHCCDDAVLAAHGDAHEFAEALASLEQKRWSASEAVVAANGGHLLYRIQRLLNPRYSRPRLTAAPAFSAALLLAAGALAVSVGHAQDQPTRSSPPRPVPVVPAAPGAPAQAAPAAPSPSPSELQTEPQTPYTKWVNEEVFWIITPEERDAFRRLTTDDERERFIENFWLNRDPTPNTVENEYREEYYRRILYADDNFSSGIPGWKTDRGMIYIKYGPPNEREAHPSGGKYQRPIEEGGGATQVYPFEIWKYRYIQGVGKDVVIEFVDSTGKGEYHMTADPSEKDTLLYVPGAGLTLVEQLGISKKDERFNRADGTRLGTGDQPLPASMNQFQRLQAFAALQKPPIPAVAPEDAIEDIVVEGARRTPQDTVRALIHSQRGARFERALLDEDAKALWDTGRYEDVKAGFARGKIGWIVTITVVEREIPHAAEKDMLSPPAVDDRLLLHLPAIDDRLRK